MVYCVALHINLSFWLADSASKYEDKHAEAHNSLPPLLSSLLPVKREHAVLSPLMEEIRVMVKLYPRQNDN